MRSIMNSNMFVFNAVQLTLCVKNIFVCVFLFSWSIGGQHSDPVSTKSWRARSCRPTLDETLRYVIGLLRLRTSSPQWWWRRCCWSVSVLSPPRHHGIIIFLVLRHVYNTSNFIFVSVCMVFCSINLFSSFTNRLK